MASKTPQPWADGPFKLASAPSAALIKDSPENDMFVKVSADMGTVHNYMIRGLNSIYLQAPHVKPKDYAAFIGYASNFPVNLIAHHDGEEEGFFPDIEKAAGVPGLMKANVDQHRAFHDGIVEMRDYLEGLKGKENEFDGEKLVAIIDSFAPALIQHLHDELDTLANLRVHGEKMSGLMDLYNKDAETVLKTLSLFAGIPWGLFNHDATYENGRWASWPEDAPKPVIWIARHVTSWYNYSWWKFASVDSYGRPKPLYALPSQ